MGNIANCSVESVDPRFCAIVFSQQDVSRVLEEVPSWDKERDIMIARSTAVACFLEKEHFHFIEAWTFCDKGAWPKLVEKAWDICEKWQGALFDVWRYRDIDIGLSLKMTIGFFLEDALFSSAISSRIIETFKDCLFYLPSKLHRIRLYDSCRESDVFSAIFLYAAQKAGLKVQWIRNDTEKKALSTKIILLCKFAKKLVFAPMRFTKRILFKASLWSIFDKSQKKSQSLFEKCPVLDDEKPSILFKGSDFDFEGQIALVKYMQEMNDFNVLHLYEGGRDDWISKDTKLYMSENFVLDMRKINIGHDHRRMQRRNIEKAFLPFARRFRATYPEIFDNPYLHFQFEAIFGELTSSAIQSVNTAYDVLDSYRPRLLVQCQDFLCPTSCFAQVAKKMGTTTVNLPHSIIGHPAYGDFVSDYQIVYGKAEQEKLIGYGKNPNHILVTGNILGDSLHDYVKPTANRNNTGKHLIVVLTGAVDHGIVPYVDKKLYIQCIEKIVQIAKQDSNVNVILRLHPRTDNREKYERVIEKCRARERVKIEIGGNSCDSFRKASLIVVPGISSGAAVEAAFFGNPILFVGEPQVIERGVMWAKYAQYNMVHKVDDLERAIRSAFGSNEYREKLTSSGNRLFNLYNESIGAEAMRRTYRAILALCKERDS